MCTASPCPLHPAHIFTQFSHVLGRFPGGSLYTLLNHLAHSTFEETPKRPTTDCNQQVKSRMHHGDLAWDPILVVML